jgi:hypothetical protein
MDFFDLFRWVLATIATVYATVVTVQSAMGWYTWLRGTDKYITLARRYLIVHGLRLRVRTFGGDVLICGLLCITFLILWYAHGQVERLDDALHDLRRPVPRPVERSTGAEGQRGRGAEEQKPL